MIREDHVAQTFQISKEDLKLLTKLAKAQDVSKSSLIRKAIKFFLKYNLIEAGRSAGMSSLMRDEIINKYK